MNAPDRARTLSLRARYVFPVAGGPLSDGVITIADGRIVSIEKYAAGQVVEDLGDVAILPGLVNAHTHLEFTRLDQQLAEPGTPLPEWIRRVIEHRRTRPESVEADIASGLQESLAAGVTAIGEIATTVWPEVAWPSASKSTATESCAADDATARPDVSVFLEMMALSAARVPERLAAAERFLAAPARAFRPALSPHAPYTVHPDLLAGCVELSRRFHVPLAMHLAESPEELQLLQSSSGGFRDLLESLGRWSPETVRPDSRVLDYLRVLSTAERALVIHGNYLDGEEIKILAANAARMSVVYCPRTHDYFRHAPYPLAEMLARGISLALGTDSRASNPDLDLFAEMRHVVRHHADVRPSRVLELGTLGGARALGIADVAGSLTPGKRADLAVVSLRLAQAADPHELLFADESRVMQTWLGGVAKFRTQA